MIFSANYHSKEARVGEIKCPYNQLGTIKLNKRINIISGDPSPKELQRLIDQVEIVKEEAPDYTIECGDIGVFDSLKSKGYNAYLRFPATDWETFQSLRTCGVSDIHIDGPLGFQANKLASGKGKIKIRVSPTVSLNSSLIGRTPKSFFIRPEDLSIYENVIDVVDFSVIGQQEKEDALLSIYYRKYFYYPIDQLIPGLPSINNSFFKNDFATTRFNCKQVCMIPGRYCNYCSNYFKMLEKTIELIGAEHDVEPSLE